MNQLRRMRLHCPLHRPIYPEVQLFGPRQTAQGGMHGDDSWRRDFAGIRLCLQRRTVAVDRPIALAMENTFHPSEVRLIRRWKSHQFRHAHLGTGPNHRRPTEHDSEHVGGGVPAKVLRDRREERVIDARDVEPERPDVPWMVRNDISR